MTVVTPFVNTALNIALSLSSDSSDSTHLQSDGSGNNLHVSSSSVGAQESTQGHDAAGLNDAATIIPPSSSLKGSSIIENPSHPVAPIASTKKDSPKTISLFRLFPSVESSDSSGSDGENESAHQNSNGSLQTKVLIVYTTLDDDSML